jgi:hypothetical protein
MKEDPANLLRATIVSTSIHDHVVSGSLKFGYNA